jgi:hypothetical protein
VTAGPAPPGGGFRSQYSFPGFDALFATAVRGVERLDATRLRLALAGPAELDATVRDLVERESQCCSFFPFTLATDRPGHIVLDIGNPAAYVDVLDALTRRVTAQAAR